MNIYNQKQLELALKGEFSDEINITDCGISSYQLAYIQDNSLTTSISQIITQAGQLDKIYRKNNPTRHTKANPHLATAVLIRADQNTVNNLKFPGYQQAMNNLYMALEILCRDANRAEIWLLIENPADKFLLSPLELRDMVDELNTPWLKIFLNHNNINPSLDATDFQIILGCRVFT